MRAQSQSAHPSGVRSGRAGFIDTRMSGRENRSVFKQEVDRRSRLSPQLQRAVRARNGVPKPYDPALLRDTAGHSVAQAYIDTLAQDVAGARWRLVPRDEEAEVSEEEIAEAERTLQSIHPEKSFRDILEQLTRNLLELGDAALIKHYFENSDELAEAVPMDSARMFKRVDAHGLTQGYLQASFTNLEMVDDGLDTEEVVWLEWASRTDHVYGHGPVEKGLDVILLLEELSEKEKKDLMEGMPPGIVSAREDADNPLPVDEYETVKEQFEMAEGERHRVVVSRGEWDYTDFSGNYQELQILDREKFWIHVLGAVMKVNPPYAGFDFQEGNKAQNEAQAEAFRQRGFRQTLRQIEEGLTRQLVLPDLHEDLRFEFEREQTVAERTENAEMLERAAQAAEAWAQNGRNVTVHGDGTITIEDGEVTPEDVETEDAGGGGGGGGGGLFASTDKGQRTAKAVPLEIPMGEDPVPEDALDEWREFLEAIEMEGGMVMDAESGRTFPGEELAPSGALSVFGVAPETLQQVLGMFENVSYEVEDLQERPVPEAMSEVPETPASTETLGLSKSQITKMDDLLLEAYEEQIQPESIEEIEKRSWSGDYDVPGYVKEAIEFAIDEANAVFSDIDSVPDETVERLEGLLKDELTGGDWSLSSIMDSAKQMWPAVDEDDLEVVVRTETASTLNTAREKGYEERPESGRFSFKWVGPQDERTTDACEELKERTNPDHGGTPMSLPDLKREMREVANEHFPTLQFRDDGVIHPNERHTWVRHVEAGGSPPDPEDVITDEERERRQRELS